MSLNFMLIDSHYLMYEGVLFTLREAFADCNLSYYANGRAAIAHFERDASLSLDLIIVDRNLADMDMWNLPDEVHARYPNVPILMYSAYAEIEIVAKAFACGVSGYLSKQASPAEFLCAVDRLVRGENYYPPGITPTLLAPYAERFSLTPRQLEVLACLAKGKTNKEIALNLDISVSTVKQHLHTLYRIFNATSRTACVARAREVGVLIGSPTS